jgi:hypothetical protein
VFFALSKPVFAAAGWLYLIFIGLSARLVVSGDYWTFPFEHHEKVIIFLFMI